MVPTTDQLLRALLLQGVDFADVRGKLPVHATKRYPLVDPAAFAGIVVHHSGPPSLDGLDGLIALTRYTVEQRKCSDGSVGWPGCPYDLAIGSGGLVYLCHDLDAGNYHAGWRPRPGDENAEFLGVVVLGNFAGPHNDTDGAHDPTLAQVEVLGRVIRALRSIWPGWIHTENRALWLHADLGKPACPGEVLSRVIRAERERLV